MAVAWLTGAKAQDHPSSAAITSRAGADSVMACNALRQSDDTNRLPIVRTTTAPA